MSKHVPTVTIVHGLAKYNDHYLVIQERDGSWYVPAGRVEQDETIVEGMERETWEEAAIEVDVTGLFKVRHGFLGEGKDRYARLTFFFEINPHLPEAPSPDVFAKMTKEDPDEHTLQAGWFTLDEIRRLPLRTLEVIGLITEYNFLKSKNRILPIEALEVYSY